MAGREPGSLKKTAKYLVPREPLSVSIKTVGLVLATISVTIIGIYVAFAPPDGLSPFAPQVSNNLSIIIGAVIGVIFTAVFFWWIENAQDKLEKEQSQGFLDLLYPMYIAAYRLGQNVALLYVTKGEDFGPQWKNIEIYCKDWGWDDEDFFRAAKILFKADQVKASIGESYVEMRRRFYDRISRKSGYPAADMFAAGVFITLLAGGKGKIPPKWEDVQFIMRAMRGFYIKGSVLRYCAKTFEKWHSSNNKIEATNVLLFLQLVDNHINSAGSRDPKALDLKHFISSRPFGTVLPPQKDFKSKAEKILKDFPSYLQARV